VFDFARFSYDNVIAEDGHVVAVFNSGATGTDAIIKIARMKTFVASTAREVRPIVPIGGIIDLTAPSSDGV
jgi:hypothetical protein